MQLSSRKLSRINHHSEHSTPSLHHTISDSDDEKNEKLNVSNQMFENYEPWINRGVRMKNFDLFNFIFTIHFTSLLELSSLLCSH